MVWLVTEIAYGRTLGWRHFLDYDEALRTATRWMATSAGVVSPPRLVEVEA
jgi:hypothetical protein